MCFKQTGINKIDTKRSLYKLTYQNGKFSFPFCRQWQPSFEWIIRRKTKGRGHGPERLLQAYSPASSFLHMNNSALQKAVSFQTPWKPHGPQVWSILDHLGRSGLAHVKAAGSSAAGREAQASRPPLGRCGSSSSTERLRETAANTAAALVWLQGLGATAHL